jgi:hypothetical protein
MSRKKETYVEYELDYLESKLIELKGYIDARPLAKLKDRMQYKETKSGGMVQTCVATIEGQRKDITQALKDYAEILQTVKRMRELEEAKNNNVRGSQGLSPLESGEI